jgi:hypothetical protein
MTGFSVFPVILLNVCWISPGLKCGGEYTKQTSSADRRKLLLSYPDQLKNHQIPTWWFIPLGK